MRLPVGSDAVCDVFGQPPEMGVTTGKIGQAVGKALLADLVDVEDESILCTTCSLDRRIDKESHAISLVGPKAVEVGARSGRGKVESDSEILSRN